MKRWFAVYTHPRGEAIAVENLLRQGFEVFFPRYLKRRSHARRVEMVPAPLFPRYLFVSFDACNTSWRVIRSTRGVIDLVCNGFDPIPVPEELIEEIRCRRDEKGNVVLAKQLKLKRGAPFRIGVGPFVDYDAIFESRRDENRVMALVSLLGRKVVVELPIAAVMPVSVR